MAFAAQAAGTNDMHTQGRVVGAQCAVPRPLAVITGHLVRGLVSFPQHTHQTVELGASFLGMGLEHAWQTCWG